MKKVKNGLVIAFGQQDQQGEQDDVDRVRRPGQLGVEPPIAPGRDDDRGGKGDVGGEQRIGRGGRLRRLAGVDQDGEQEQRRQHQPAKGDDAPGRMLKSLPHDRADIASASRRTASRRAAHSLRGMRSSHIIFR